MERLPLFVFGTLRRGEENHHYLAGRYDRVRAASLPDFRRETAAHGYPAAVAAPGESVEGELFFLTPQHYDAVLRDCDLLEDLPPDKLVGEYYCRARVSVITPDETLTAWAYIDPRAASDCSGR